MLQLFEFLSNPIFLSWVGLRSRSIANVYDHQLGTLDVASIAGSTTMLWVDLFVVVFTVVLVLATSLWMNRLVEEELSKSGATGAGTEGIGCVMAKTEESRPLLNNTDDHYQQPSTIV